MRDNLRAAAPYISVFGLLLLAGAAIVGALAGREGQNIPPWLPPALAILGVVLVLAYPVIRWDEFTAIATGRRARYGSNAIVNAVAVIGILAVIAVLGTRRYRIWDLTANKQYSISHQTIQILDSLTSSVNLTAVLPYYESGQTYTDLKRLVDKYAQVQPGKITLEKLTPQDDPIAWQAIQQRTNGDAPPRGLVAESDGHHAVVYAFDEQAVSEAILKATRVVTKTIYFTAGHNEIPLQMAGEDGRGLGVVNQQLLREGYAVETLTITGTLPAADAIVVAGPQRPFQQAEAVALRDYVAKGGSLMVLLEPLSEHGLEPALLPWEIRTPNDLVIDPPRSWPQAPWMLIPGDALQFHTITKGLENLNTLLPASRSLSTGTPVTTSMQVTKLIESSDSAWGETNLEALSTQGAAPQRDPEDSQPPLTLALAGDGGEDYGRIVVFGTAGVAVDGLLQQFGGLANLDLFLNSVDWLTQEEELIAIRPTQPDDRPMTPPTSPTFLILVTALFMPAVVLGVGAWVYTRRR